MTDYISRENFLADKRRLYCENCDRRKGTKNGKTKIVYDIGDAPCRACGIGDVLDDVEEYPAADVVPVSHGRWERKPDPFGFFDTIPVCSACGNTTKFRKEYPYCPYCGARMQEAKQDAID